MRARQPTRAPAHSSPCLPVHAQLPAPRAAPPTAPTRPANWPPPSPNRAPPARHPPAALRPPSGLPAPLRPFPPSPPGAGPPVPILLRARLLARPTTRARARLTPPDRTPARAAPCLPACLPACLPGLACPSGRARLRRPFSYTYPPTSTGPQPCVQTFRGPKVVPGEAHFRWPAARLPRGHVPRPTGHRPSSAGGRARASYLTGPRASPSPLANWHGPMDGEIPREPVGTGPPASSGERCSRPPPSARRCRTRWWEVFANKSSQGSG